MSANRILIRSNRSRSALGHRAAIALLLLFYLCGCHAAGPTAVLHPIDPSMALPNAETLEFPGPERFWNKAGIVISPARIVAQVGSEVPMFAGICNGKGELMPHEEVEWMLDNGGVGSFVSVADPLRPICLEVVSSKVRKVDNSYALTETSPANIILTRGTADINDDMVMPRGYTWVTVTSPVEGSSYVTAYGPDVYSWDVRRKSARIIWVDADWHFPEGACAKTGVPVMLTTCVERHTTKAPVSDWIVKYTITGGVAAGFGADNAQSVEIATGEDGRASVEVVPAAEANGTVCISVELIRSECAGPDAGERLSLATAATQVTWGIPDPPAPPPTPPAEPTAVAPTPAGSTPTPPPTTPPPAIPNIGLKISGPTTAELGSDIAFTIEVTNKGTTTATDLILTDRFDDGLKHVDAVGGLQSSIAKLEPGQVLPVVIRFRAIKPGSLCHTAEITDAKAPSQGPVFAREKACVEVRELPKEPATLNVTVSGPPNSVVGQEVRFFVKVDNVGDLPAQQVEINVGLDPTLKVTGVDDKSGLVTTPAGALIWKIDTLQGKSSVTHQIGCQCLAPAAKACCTATSTIAGREPRAHEQCIAIDPAPVAAQGPLKVQVAGNPNPVRVGGNVTYRVTITNIGRFDEPQVRLKLILPPEMSIVGAPRFNAKEETGNDKQIIQFQPILVLRPNEPVNCDLVLRANRTGQANLRAEVTSLNVMAPLSGTATTTISQ